MGPVDADVRAARLYGPVRPPETRPTSKPLAGFARAALITTHLDYEEWHNFLGNKGLVTALLSRLRHQCHTVKIDGPSLREPEA